MTYLVLTLVALLSLAVQSTLFTGQVVSYFRPDCILALTVLAGFHLSPVPGLLYACFLGCLAEALSGAPDGWNVLLMTVVFSFTYVLRSQIFIGGLRSRTMPVILWALAKGPCFFLLMKATGHPLPLSRTMVLHWMGEAAATTGATVALFGLIYNVLGVTSLFASAQQREISQ